MVHGENAVAIGIPAGIAGKRTNPQRKTNRFPAGSDRNPAFHVGVFLGIGFSVVGLAWLLLANRVPHLDQFAGERNLALAVAFSLLGSVPTCRFMKSPVRNFLSGVTGWAILTAIYSVAEVVFPRLATRLSAFHLFVLGCVLFGLLAVMAWVVNLVIVFRRARTRADARMGLRYATSPR